MVVNNIKELLLKSVNKSGKKDIIIKSIIWNSIIEEFLIIKNIDIKNYIKGIDLKGNIIIVKTGKPILNTELKNYEENIKKQIEKRLTKTGILIVNLTLKFK